ncbi:MAG: bifunctional UDP-N-acetylglucosamine diphosphorylase/glucosamine-1-phosphate N-acetyltransferase GlmU [Elusimicrobiota bacterium]|nr:bifunctional UDP-N-acetylglucosamine diphosphorylase/glucosamine-1-phosphate N-acetyltransferase GlmU [Elusimicrobiota bacterium]
MSGKKFNFSVLILAAGLGTRMKSEKPKVLHELAGLPLIIHAIKQASVLNPDKIIIVVGHKADLVENAVNQYISDSKFKIKVEFVRQKLLKGSGRAVQESIFKFKNFNHIMIMCGDAPLLQPETIKKMNSLYKRKKGAAIVLTANLDSPGTYGRIKRSSSGFVEAIIEAEGASSEELAIKEINSGAYIFKVSSLIKALKNLKPKGGKKEYYLTDAIENMKKEGAKIAAFKTLNFDETRGINSHMDLAMAYKIIYKRKADKLMASGVTIIDPDNTYIDESVKIGRGTIVYPGMTIQGKTMIGKNCRLGPSGVIQSCKLGDNVEIKFSCFLILSEVKKSAIIGPFAHLRPDSQVGPKAKIGNFTEIKKSKIGKGSKVSHLSYIGDTLMGEKVNIGAGTITCNYDGVKKHKTIINNGAFIGSNTNLVAPVSVGRKSLIGAGSTITKNIPDNKLALARAREVFKPLKKRK